MEIAEVDSTFRFGCRLIVGIWYQNKIFLRPVILQDESAEEWERRVSFSLEILNVKTLVPVTANLLTTLFAIVKRYVEYLLK